MQIGIGAWYIPKLLCNHRRGHLDAKADRFVANESQCSRMCGHHGHLEIRPYRKVGQPSSFDPSLDVRLGRHYSGLACINIYVYFIKKIFRYVPLTYSSQIP